MFPKVSLCLAAIASLIAASAAYEPAGKPNLANLRSRFQNVVSAPVVPQSAASATAASPGSSASASAVSGAPRYVSRYAPPARYPNPAPLAAPAPVPAPAPQPAPAPAPRQFAARPRYAPAHQTASAAASSSASGAGSVASVAGPSGSASASAQHSGFRYAPRRVAPAPRRFQAPPEEEEEEEETFFGPESHQPVAQVHPPVPRVTPNRFNLNNRVRFGQGGSVSTSAAAGAGSASAASATGGHTSAAHATNGPSTASASASTHAAPAHYDAHELDHEHTAEHYSEPETVDEYEATSGGYANDGHGVLTSSYVRSTESEENHEDGKEDSDHYYNAGSYGKTYDENHSESYDNDDEDILHTKNVYRAKKSSTKYQKDASKQRRESGSRVLAKDRHSASYNKDNKKFKENVDQHYHKEGAGVLESGHSSEASDFDEEAEEARDSRNLGNFRGIDGVLHGRRARFNPAAAAAASAGSAGASSSVSAGHH